MSNLKITGNEIEKSNTESPEIKKPHIRISVRNLVEFLLRSGDIDNRAGGKNEMEAMQQGSRLHRKIQGRMKGNYQAEVPLKVDVPYPRFMLTVEGRADGIESSYDKDGAVTTVLVDEIKCMYRDVTRFEQADRLHEAQALCYGYMYLLQCPVEEVTIQITYVNIETEEIKRLKKTYSFLELQDWFLDLLHQYEKWVTFLVEHGESKIATAKNVEFPFSYRPGQKDITRSVYWAIKNQRELFIQAPTGVGKTMSVIFPAVKAVGENLADKIFYLTAKTITGQVPHDSFERLRSRGLDFKCTAITAKDKLCVLKERKCNPQDCERACGHFDRINEAVYDVIVHENDITREVVTAYAEKYRVCPYEMNLDISNFVDAIICDYNYVFDPVASLKRYFSGGNSESFLFLVDESHNLVERARSMYSAEIVKEDVLAVKKLIGARDKRVTGALEKCNRTLLSYKRRCDEADYCYLEEIGDFVWQLEKLYGYMEKFLDDHKEFDDRDIVLNFYFDLIHFLNMFECTSHTDENDKSFYEICGHLQEDGSFHLRLMCMNPADNLKNYIERAVSTIFFSATFLPINYYKLLLSGDIDSYAIYIDSPFSKENRRILIADDVSSRYTRRTEGEYRRIAGYIERIAGKKKGNYMIFAPSYKFMEEIASFVEGDFEIVLQKQFMEERERETFLEAFEEIHEKTFLCFCVMGGIFSEGIDLTEDKLIGSIIIGTGLPQVCMEKEVTKQYFNEIGMNGFAYAYLYPGINKVLQAAGRVIRTEKDAGVIALLDERFLKKEYLQLFPREWDDWSVINARNVEKVAEEFWREMDEKGRI